MAKEKIESLKDVKEEVKRDKPEFISDTHLESMKRLVNAISSMQYNIGKLEQQKHQTLHNLSMAQDRVTIIQDTLQKEYGTYDVNIEDGRINYPETNIDKTDNEK